MVSSDKTRISAQEYLALPETTIPTQLLSGEIIVSPSPTPEHQDAILTIAVWLRSIAKERNGRVFVAPMDVYFDEQNIPQPDIIYIAPDSKCGIGEKYLIGPPDLIVEVLSPSTAKADKRDKFLLYERYGVREYWIVDTRNQFMEVWQFQEGRFKLLDVYSPGDRFESAIVGYVEVTALFGL